MLLKEVNSFCVFFNRIRRLMLYPLLILVLFPQFDETAEEAGGCLTDISDAFFCANTCKKRTLAFSPRNCVALPAGGSKYRSSFSTRSF